MWKPARFRGLISSVIAAMLVCSPTLADSLGSVAGGQAGNQSSLSGGICQSAPVALSNGQQASFLVDCTTHALLTEGTGGGGSSSVVLLPGSAIAGKFGIDQTTPGTTNGVQTLSGSVTNTSPAARTIVPLDVSTVTTGGTAVTALAAGHRSAGGFLTNPKGATVDLCINEQGTASGTTSAGATTCVSPGQAYQLAATAGAVSVVTSDSSHPFSGYGLN